MTVRETTPDTTVCKLSSTALEWSIMKLLGRGGVYRFCRAVITQSCGSAAAHDHVKMKLHMKQIRISFHRFYIVLYQVNKTKKNKACGLSGDNNATIKTINKKAQHKHHQRNSCGTTWFIVRLPIVEKLPNNRS